MKLSLTLHEKTHSVESEDQFDGQDVYELTSCFKGLLVSAGFHPQVVDQAMGTDEPWFTEQETNLFAAWKDLAGSAPDASTKHDNFDDEIEAGSNNETDHS